MSKVIVLQDVYILEVDELYVKNSNLISNSIKSKFFKDILEKSLGLTDANSFGFIC